MVIFEVENKVLKLGGYQGPKTRNEAFDITDSDFDTVESCIEKISEYPGLALAFEWLYEDWWYLKSEIAEEKDLPFDWSEDFVNDYPDENIKLWLESLSEGEFLWRISYMDQWLSQPYIHSDFDQICGHYIGIPSDAYEAAYEFFGSHLKLCNDLNIDVIDGDTFGNSFTGAMLNITVEEANERAKDLNHDIEFINCDNL